MNALAFLMAHTPTKNAIAETLYDFGSLVYNDLYSRVRGIVSKNLLEHLLPKELESAKEYFGILRGKGMIDEQLEGVYVKTIEEYKTEEMKIRPSEESFNWHLERFIRHGLVRVYEEKYELTKLGSESVKTFMEILEEVE